MKARFHVKHRVVGHARARDPAQTRRSITRRPRGSIRASPPQRLASRRAFVPRETSCNGGCPADPTQAPPRRAALALAPTTACASATPSGRGAAWARLGCIVVNAQPGSLSPNVSGGAQGRPVHAVAGRRCTASSSGGAADSAGPHGVASNRWLTCVSINGRSRTAKAMKSLSAQSRFHNSRRSSSLPKRQRCMRWWSSPMAEVK